MLPPRSVRFTIANRSHHAAHHGSTRGTRNFTSAHAIPGIRDVTGCRGMLAGFRTRACLATWFYGRPTGRLLLALRHDPAGVDEPIGCVGLRKLEKGICEMKRLYVRSGFRKEGVGQVLVENLIADACALGYKKLRLDTLPSMREAQALYKRLGFVEIPAYLKNPTPNALCFELALSQT